MTANRSDPIAASNRDVAKDPAFSLKGNTLRVYMHILMKGAESVGVREIQNELNFSSPSLARYHLEKLKEMGLLKQNGEGGSYVLLKEVKVDVLHPFLTLGSLIIPRLVTYAVMMTILFVCVILFVIPSSNFVELEFFAIVMGSLSVIALWYESLRSWRSAPKS